MAGEWLAKNWLEVLQSMGIIGGLFFTGIQLLFDIRTRRVANRLLITGHHRDLWKVMLRHPQLSRVTKVDVDLSTEPVTLEEARFVNLVLLHLSASHYAATQGLVPMPEQLGKDIRQFLSRPIPQQIWKEGRELRDRDFIDFVERHLED